MKSIKEKIYFHRKGELNNMNPVLIVLVALGVVLLWFLLSFAFKPIGALFTALWKDAIDEIKEENKEEKENN